MTYCYHYENFQLGTQTTKETIEDDNLESIHRFFDNAPSERTRRPQSATTGTQVGPSFVHEDSQPGNVEKRGNFIRNFSLLSTCDKALLTLNCSGHNLKNRMFYEIVQLQTETKWEFLRILSTVDTVQCKPAI